MTFTLWHIMGVAIIVAIVVAVIATMAQAPTICHTVKVIGRIS